MIMIIFLDIPSQRPAVEFGASRLINNVKHTHTHTHTHNTRSQQTDNGVGLCIYRLDLPAVAAWCGLGDAATTLLRPYAAGDYGRDGRDGRVFEIRRPAPILKCHCKTGFSCFVVYK